MKQVPDPLRVWAPVRFKGGAMNCPECKVTLKPFDIGDDQINECPACRGLWFKKGQLDSVKDEVLPEMGWMDIGRLKNAFDFKSRTDTLTCPQCYDTDLTRFEDQKTSTEFSYCPHCKGTWLATGQFLNLVNLLLDEVDEKTASELAIITLRQAKDLLLKPHSSITTWQSFESVLSLLKHRVFIENPNLRSVIAGLEKSLPL
jgi:Zn-finger nucleic acid-binding protein